ncbi:hypothetical protein [Haliangium sp. UPWRP_2]|uniref:hypothetical protein n=1 Tax=Haliangium sp. UPWRP_2 TaxID=1931276 RepID=UPI0018ED21E2|nr:hypothetical protein [Haliangium sp. UPWRP_2]HNN96327.1 hypothetical protein [Pseudomonadota bacterium]
MSRNHPSAGKQAKEAERARKQQAKAARRLDRRDRRPGQIEIASAEDIHGPLPSIGDVMLALETRGTTPRAATMIPCRLFVGGLSWNIEAPQLRAAFSTFGPVADAAVITDRGTGKSRGFGFVTMANRKDATKAIDGLHNTELDGHRIVVNVASER